MFVESFRDISQIFEDRREQFSVYKRLLIIMLLLNAVLIYGVSWWTVYPIRKLSRATRTIAKGQYSGRVIIRSRDELGYLAEDFNKMADSLEEKIHDLEAAANRQRDFVGSFAHELKTPLTSIIGYADMLRSQQMDEHDRTLAAGYIFSEGKRLEALSLKLLELIILQNRDFEMKEVNLKALFHSISASMFPILGDSQIRFRTKAQNATVLIEPDLMKTLILNLLDNARKSIAGPGAITLSGYRVNDGEYVICVEDTGKGIPPGEIARITEAFYMVDKSRSRAVGGAGLGLAICSEIAALHGGGMAFESSVEQGTKVTLRLRG